MTMRPACGPLAGCLAAGLLMSMAAAESHATPLRAAWPAPPLESPLHQVAEKKTQKKSDGAKSQVKSGSGSTSATQKAQPSRSQSGGGQSGGSGGGASTSTGTKSSGSGDRGGSTGGGLTVGQPSKTTSPPPDPKAKQPIGQDRVVGKTPSLEDSLRLTPPGKGERGEEEAPVLTAPEEGGTYTTQVVTPEELDQIAEEHEEVSDVDGDGDYEVTESLSEEAVVEVDDGVAYIDTDGDGTVEYAVPADNYNAEANEVYLPISTESVLLDEDGSTGLDYDVTQGYVWYDSDGDGVDELYSAQDSDGDGVADLVAVEYEEGSGYSNEELEALIEEKGANVFDYPGTTAEADGQDGKRPRVKVGLSVAPSSATAAATAPAGADSELLVSLQQLKLLHDQRVLDAVEYDNAQLRALAEIGPDQGSIEGGLTLLRALWQRRLITESPYARKRRELLDAL